MFSLASGLPLNSSKYLWDIIVHAARFWNMAQKCLWIILMPERKECAIVICKWTLNCPPYCNNISLGNYHFMVWTFKCSTEKEGFFIQPNLVLLITWWNYHLTNCSWLRMHLIIDITKIWSDEIPLSILMTFICFIQIEKKSGRNISNLKTALIIICLLLYDIGRL